MNVFDAIENRRSIRKFKPDDMPEPVLNKILDAARLAPSGCNRQAWKLIVVRDKATISKILTEACIGRFPGPNDRVAGVVQHIAGAPVLIVACIIVQDANMRYFGTEKDDPVMFSNLGRETDSLGFWDEYIEHTKTHRGEYESLGVWDLAIALDHLSLAALDVGLGTCWISAMDENAFRRILSVPDEIQPRMVMALGYPDGVPGPRPRKPIDEVVCYEKYR